MPAPKGNQYAKGNKGGGRPSAYQAKFAKQARRACEAGFTDKELAELLGCSLTTLYQWKADHQEFSEALKIGKEQADDRVAMSLYHRATGYSHPEVDVRVVDGRIVQTPLIKHYPPDTTAAIFWLKNRRPEEWREKKEVTVNPPLFSSQERLREVLANIEIVRERHPQLMIDCKVIDDEGD